MISWRCERIGVVALLGQRGLKVHGIRVRVLAVLVRLTAVSLRLGRAETVVVF